MPPETLELPPDPATPSAPVRVPAAPSLVGTLEADATSYRPLPAAVDSPPGFAVGAEIGRGGMGVVYRAKDLDLGRDVAVKVLQDRYPAGGAAAGRFVDEARITSQLQHPGVPAVYRVGALPDGRPYLAMKLVEGQNLSDILAAGPMGGAALAVFEGILQAVGYAHSKGLIHRDLKPANVMVGAFSEVQVMDWGLAKVVGSADGVSASESDAGSSDRTAAGSVMGTPAYMPPEQAAGGVVTVRADVFGLGAVLCALLTGRPPFEGVDPEAVRLAAARGDTAGASARLDASGVDPDVIALCKRCLGVDPADRPAHGGAVAAAVAGLRSAADDRARRAEVERAEATVRAAEQARRRLAVQWAAGAVAAVLLVGVAGTTVGMVRADTARRAEVV